LQQDFEDFEVIVVDDGSTDNTEEVVRQFSDKRISYYKKQNGERGAARNFGRAKAKGVYVNFTDSDDVLYPNHLSAARSVITTYKLPEFFHLGYDLKTPDGTVVRTLNNWSAGSKDHILYDNSLSCNGVFLRKDVAEKFPFVEDRKLASSEDWQLWIRLISRYDLQFSNSVTSTLILHDQRSLYTISSEKVIARDVMLIDSLSEDTEVRKKYGAGFNRFIAHRYTFFMLRLALDKRRADMLKWAWKAIKVYPLIFLSKRFLASLKNSM
jgi:glycosyltransferase involved in cell wall biosynthesis